MKTTLAGKVSGAGAQEVAPLVPRKKPPGGKVAAVNRDGGRKA
jgi:hypothetical protein